MEMVLGPETGPLDDAGLARAYAWPDDLEQPWVRGMYAMTLEGSYAGPDGVSRSIGSDADSAVFAESRRLADTVLVGAGTVKAERYGALRAAEGEATAPRAVVVSGSLDLPWDLDLWSGSEHTPVILTSGDADDDATARAAEHAELVTLPGDDLHAEILAWLHERSLRRVVCEGGPSLLAGLVDADGVDEICLTLAPRLTAGGQPDGGDPRRIVETRLQHVVSAEGNLFARYLVERPAG